MAAKKRRKSAKRKTKKRKVKRRAKKRSRKKAKKRRKSSKKRKGNKRKKSKRKGSKTTSRKGKKSLIDKVPILRNKTVQKIAFGLGMGVIAVQIIDLAARVAPPALAQPLVQNRRIIKLGVEAVTEPLSAAADLVLSGGAGNLLGGSGGNGSMNTSEFA